MESLWRLHAIGRTREKEVEEFERLRERLLFFFQAEDGIRDTSVTGVQTCALPISLGRMGPAAKEAVPMLQGLRSRNYERSEERRVGKECRSRGLAWHEKKK